MSAPNDAAPAPGQPEPQDPASTHAAPPNQAAHQAPAPGAQPASGPAFIQIPMSQLQELMEGVRERNRLEYEKLAAQKESQAREADNLVKVGKAEEAIKAVREQAAKEVAEKEQRLHQAEERARAYVRDRELAEAISDYPIHKGQLRNLMKLLKDDLEAHPEGDGYAVRTSTTFLPVREHVKKFFADPENGCYLRPSTQGGVGNTGASQAAPTPAGTPPPSGGPVTEMDRVMAFYQSKAPAQADPAANMDQPFGLRATRAPRN